MTGNADKESPTIPGYEVLERLGRGGMADVYLGTQLSLARPVAIKVLTPERTSGEQLVTRFEHEARTIARLDHPNIVSIFDVGRTEDGRLYYVMPYLANGDLSTHRMRDDEILILATVRALCSALGYAHGLGVVHRDVKPENVLFDKSDRPLLADFGIALTSHEAERVTQEGSTMGSSGYMSPEQARGFALDGRADLYSLGVVAYELLSGDLPFHGPDTLAVALAHVEQPIPRLPATRQRWQPFIDKAMAKSPAQRFQTAAQMEQALDAIGALLIDDNSLGYATKALPILRLATTPIPARSRLGLACAFVLIVIGVGMLIGALGNFIGPARSESKLAASELPPAPPAVAEPQPTAIVSAGSPAEPATLSSTDAVATTPENYANAGGAHPATPVVKPKPVKPTRLRLADLEPGALLRDRDGPDLSFVPATVTRDGDSYDVRHVFALARYETSRNEYEMFARATGRPAADCKVPNSPLSMLKKLSWREPGFDQDPSHPVVCVSWDDANAYVAWLSERTHAHYRLPSHAEWMHATHWNSNAAIACSQGNLSDEKSSLFHKGDGAGCRDGYAHTAPRGKFQQNSIAIFDLIGNASEWNSDCLRGERTRKPTDGTACAKRMFSGSSWRDAATEHPFEVQDTADPDAAYNTIGFRVLREVDDDDVAALVKPESQPKVSSARAETD